MAATSQQTEQTRTDPGDSKHSNNHHVAFLPLLDSEKAARHEQRKHWRKPLYQLPLGEIT
jgi:hypothetical protein